MTTGSWIVDEVRRHMVACGYCREADPEGRRIKHDQPGRVSERDIPAGVLAAMCADGRSIYRSYLRWLAEPED